MLWAPILESTKESQDFHLMATMGFLVPRFDVVDIVNTVDTADIVHTIDTLDIVKNFNSVDNVGSINRCPQRPQHLQ